MKVSKYAKKKTEQKKNMKMKNSFDLETLEYIKVFPFVCLQQRLSYKTVRMAEKMFMARRDTTKNIRVNYCYDQFFFTYFLY